MHSAHSKSTYLLLVIVAALSASACSPLQTINVLSPSAHYSSDSDIAYGSLPRQMLDIYTPQQAKLGAPVVVFFYGGGWDNGDKHDYEFVASSLAEAGYTVVIPDYRVYPDVVFPEFVEDGALAVAWVLSNSELVSTDQTPVYLMGHSAGAHIAAMVSYDPHYLNDQAADPAAIAGFIGLSGPYDFLPLGPSYLREVFPEDIRDDSQPINHVTKTSPPTLLVHGLDDKLVESGNSTRLEKKLSELGVPVTLHLYEDIGHARVAVALSQPFEFTGDVLKDTIAFLDARTELSDGESHNSSSPD
ncbi:MAG: alpha/beta hydrolase [Pseudomonadota bacterium]